MIHKSAQGLLEMITDLLEMARIEAGKTIVHPDEFQVADLYRALRGALRPIKPREGVSLILEDPSNIPPMCSDEGKITQILRNLISNAIKFTEKGEIRVSARLTPSGENVIFSVSDTGIGIAPEDQNKIFQEFTQIESPLQKQAKGTGLGLSLSRRLATLLGGSISVKSRPGEGSTFSFIIPLQYEEEAAREEGMEKKAGWQIDPTSGKTLVSNERVRQSRLTRFGFQKRVFQRAHRSVPAARYRVQRYGRFHFTCVQIFSLQIAEPTGAPFLLLAVDVQSYLLVLNTRNANVPFGGSYNDGLAR